MKKVTLTFLLILSLFSSCDFNWSALEQPDGERLIEVRRYDRLESRYLTTGDYAALQQMNTDYAVETRMLLEDVLKLGEVRDPSINTRFLISYQDTVLQMVIADAQTQYTVIDDINQDLSNAFAQLKEWLPELPLPEVYMQIGTFGQSIVVGDGYVGISLDKYLGSDYPLYQHYFTKSQRESMKREYIVPDCLSFYLLSVYPLQDIDARTQQEKDLHMGKVMWVVNKAMGRRFFNTPFVKKADLLMKKNPSATIKDLLEGKLG